MAEPGDPNTPEDLTPTRPEPRATVSSLRPSWATPVRETAPHDHGHDDLIGFTSPASLQGSSRRGDTPPEPQVVEEARLSETDADLFDPRPEPVVTPAFAPIQSQRQSQSQTSVPSPLAADPTPAWALETPREPRASAVRSDAFGRARTTAEGRRIPPNAPPEGAMGLYTVYALILFAVPTLGVAAVVALIAIYGRPRPRDALAQSHYVFQQRTVWIAAIVAVAGVLMIAVNLGVFVLFFVALWVLARGAAGLLRLSGGRPIENPRTWLV